MTFYAHWYLNCIFLVYSSGVNTNDLTSSNCGGNTECCDGDVKVEEKPGSTIKEEVESNNNSADTGCCAAEKCEEISQNVEKLELKES